MWEGIYGVLQHGVGTETVYSGTSSPDLLVVLVLFPLSSLLTEIHVIHHILP